MNILQKSLHELKQKTPQAINLLKPILSNIEQSKAVLHDLEEERIVVHLQHAQLLEPRRAVLKSKKVPDVILTQNDAKHSIIPSKQPTADKGVANLETLVTDPAASLTSKQREERDDQMLSGMLKEFIFSLSVMKTLQEHTSLLQNMKNGKESSEAVVISNDSRKSDQEDGSWIQYSPLILQTMKLKLWSGIIENGSCAWRKRRRSLCCWQN